MSEPKNINKCVTLLPKRDSFINFALNIFSASFFLQSMRMRTILKIRSDCIHYFKDIKTVDYAYNHFSYQSCVMTLSSSKTVKWSILGCKMSVFLTYSIFASLKESKKICSWNIMSLCLSNMALRSIILLLTGLLKSLEVVGWVHSFLTSQGSKL